MKKQQLLHQNPLEKQNKPMHVAIIMDGNRRWAHNHELPHIAGHKQALERIDEITEYAGTIGIEYITYWAWSTKNWKRSKEFIKDILALFREQLKDDGMFQRAIDKGAEIHHLGVLDRFPQDIKKRVKELLGIKPDKKVIDVNFAVGYEGRDEILRAVKEIIKSGIDAASVTSHTIGKFLDTAGQPDVDLLIRTGGEHRTSGYLVWQAADAEYYFTNTFMPDFTVSEFQKALADYSQRERRLGGDSQRY